MQTYSTIWACSKVQPDVHADVSPKWSSFSFMLMAAVRGGSSKTMLGENHIKNQYISLTLFSWIWLCQILTFYVGILSMLTGRSFSLGRQIPSVTSLRVCLYERIVPMLVFFSPFNFQHLLFFLLPPSALHVAPLYLTFYPSCCLQHGTKCQVWTGTERTHEGDV